MKISTQDLIGAALDWAVANAAGMLIEIRSAGSCDRPLYVLAAEPGRTPWVWSPSTSWYHGGPIIEREGINLTMFVEGEVDLEGVGSWCAAYDRDNFGDDEKSCTASTPLIAAMRCYVTSKLGDEVEVPEELTCSPTPKND